MIGSPSAMHGISTATAVDAFWFVCIAVVARTKPRNMLPVSPMKIDAGIEVVEQEPEDRRRPARTRTASSAGGRAARETRNVVTTATSATPPASPSRPSIRFIALMTPTIQSIVNGRLAQPSAIGSPNGLASTSNAKSELEQQARHQRTGPGTSSRRSRRADRRRGPASAMLRPPTNRPMTCSRSATNIWPTPLVKQQQRRPAARRTRARSRSRPAAGSAAPWILRDDRAWSSAPKRCASRRTSGRQQRAAHASTG